MSRGTFVEILAPLALRACGESATAATLKGGNTRTLDSV
jgi:hypothetical protein